MTAKGLVACVVSVIVVTAGMAGVARADGGDPIGAFDFVSRLGPSQYGACYNGTCQPARSVWHLAGWAADPDASGQSLHVHVYLDGMQISDSQTGYPRPDVAAVYPWAGDNAGWDLIVPIADDAAHTLCVYAINAGAGTQNTTVGCRSFQAGVPNLADPQGFVDSVTLSPGAIRLQGWAGDPDAGTATHLDSYLDGAAFVTFTGDVPRDDVHVAFPELGNAIGFDQVLPVDPGLHILCLDAINDGQAGFNNPSLGCWLLDVPDAVSPGPNGARGSFDATVYTPRGTNASGDPYWMEGWAWDPTSSPALVRDRYVETVATAYCGCSTVHEVDQPTTESRPDVQRAFPDAPANTGFKIAFVAPDIANPYTPFHRYDCIYIETTGGEAFLGCHPLQTLTSQ